MKTTNFLLRSFISLFAIYISYLIINHNNIANIVSVLSCEGVQPSTLDNMYWKIEEKKMNVWHVLFRNVGIKYELAQCQQDTDTTTSLFEFRQLGPTYAGIYNPEFLWQMLEHEVHEHWALNNQAYERLSNGTIRLTGSTDPSMVFIRGHHNNVVDATMEHFNRIQRGEYHADAKNTINPNSHGRATSVSSKINSAVWQGAREGHEPHHPNQSHESHEHCKSAGSLGRGIRSPLDQFSIRDWVTLFLPLLANLHFSYTNMGFYLTIATFIVITISLLAINYEKIQTNTWIISLESIYATVHNIVVNQINAIKGQNYYPFIYCLFVFILTNNLIGMIPYSFAPTSHFILTFFISFTIVFGSTILGFILHKLRFFSLLVPSGCPLGLLPLLVLIESISYLARNISLGLRLAANILSGHMLLNILSEFTYKIMDTNFVYFFIGIVPLMFIEAFSTLELGIAFIQSQVFVVLSSSYTKDSLELH